MPDESRAGRSSAPDFDALYRTDPDPWAVAESWYERRKSNLLLAALPRERYRTGWEPGCGPGITTARLAGRVEHLVASDGSPVAVALAEERLRNLEDPPPVHCSALPDSPLSTQVDLVVVAECLYYLDDPTAALDTIWGAAAPGAHLTFMHWSGAPHDTRLSGPEVQEAAARVARRRDATRVVALTDAHFRLDVYEAAR